MTKIDGSMPRRQFLTRSALVSAGAAAIALAPSLARSRAGASAVVTANTGTEYIVNGSFEDGPLGDTIPGWTTAPPSA